MDLVISGMLRTEGATIPPCQLAVLLVLEIGDDLEGKFKAWDAADILGRSASSAVEVAGIVDGEIGNRRLPRS